MNNSRKWVSILAGIMAAIMLLSLILSVLMSTAHAAQSSSEIAEQIERLKEEYDSQQKALDALEQTLADHNKEIANMVARKDGIDQQIVILSEQLVTINQTVSAHNLLIADKQDELDSAEEKLALLQQAYRDRIRAMEEQGSVSYWSVIFQASSFSDLLDRLNMISEIAHSDEMRMNQIRQLAQQVEDAKAELVLQKAQMEEAKAALLATQDSLTKKNSEAEALLFELIAIGNEYQILIDEGEQNAADLMDELAAQEKAFDEAKYREWLATSTTKTTKSRVSGQLTNEVNGIVWYTPTTNFVVTSKYGYRYDPFTGAWTGHNGLDMGAPKNTPIVATRSGIVSFCGYQENGAGNYVWINHGDGYKSIYMHMTRYIVEQGQYVEAGEIIGYVGTTGRSTGYHLHFGLKYGSSYVDPLDYIRVK